MAATWGVESGKATYKDGDNVLIEVSGLKSDATDASGISLDDTKITVPNSLLPTSGTVSITQGDGYTLELDGATAWKEEYQLGTFSSGTVPINLHQTEGWKADDENNATSYTWTAAEADEQLATITLSNSSASNADGLSLNGTVVTVGLEAFDTTGAAATTVSISNEGNVTFTLLAGLGTVPANNATIDDPDWDATTGKITQHYSAWYSAGSTQITYTPEKTVELAAVTGFTGTGGTIDKTAKTLTVTTENVDTTSGMSISGSGDYKLVLADKDTNGKVGFDEVAARWVTGSTENTFDYKSGYTKEGWEQASNGSTITYTATTKDTAPTTDYATLTTLSGEGLASGVNADALNNGGATVDTTNSTVALATSVLNASAADNNPIKVSNSYTIMIDADQQFDYDAANQTLSVAASSDNAIITRAQNAGWTGNGTVEIKYKSEVSALTLATITGVKSAAEGVSVDKDTKVVTLAAGALSSGDGTSTYTVTIQDGTNGSDGDSTFNGFKLALAEGIQTTEVDDDTATEVKMTLDTSAGTATVNKNKKEYWTGATTTTITYHPEQEGAGAEVAKITGLDTDITTTNVVLDAANSKITLKAAALKTSDATFTGSYTVALDNDVTKENTDETDETHVTRVLEDVTDGETGNITGETAKVNKDIQAYWKVEEGKVAYHSSDEDLKGKGTTVATLTGLPSGATEADVVLTATASEKKLTLGATALQTTVGTVAEIDGSGGYTLALASGIQVTKEDDTSVTMTVNNGNVSVKNDEKAYYTVDATNQKSITYTAKSLGTGAEVAAITGLATTATNEGETPNVTLDGTTITLKDGALNKDSDTTYAVSVTGSGNYTLALDGVVQQAVDNDGVTLALEEVKESDVLKGYTATVKKNQKEYWTLGQQEGTNVNNQVTYTPAAEGTGAKVAEVTGLATTAVKDTNVILDATAKTITLNKDALPKTKDAKATLTEGSGTYTLAKGTDAPASSATYSDPTLDLSDISNGNATYKRTPSAGWDLSGNEITYTVPADETLAVITGLKTDATAAAISLNANTGVITLKKAALNETNNNEVKFTANTAGYTFALPDTVARYANTASAFAVGTPASGKATITATVSKGWTFGTNNKSLTYHDATSNVEVAKITGLNTGAESGDVTINSGTGVVTLKKAALPTTAGAKVEIVSHDAAPNDGVDTSKYLTNFTLAIDGATAEGKLGYENTGYWTQKGTTAKYYETAMEGWKVGDTKRKITYDVAQSTASTNPIVTIENLTRSLTLGKVTGSDGLERDIIGTGAGTAGDPFVAGVSINDKEITLNKNVLGIESPMTVALGIGYTLKLNDDDTSDGYVLGEQTAANVWTYGVTTTYKNVNLEYWTYDGTDTITYHPQVENVTLATITGLKGTVSAEDIADTEAYTGSIGDVTAKGTITLNKDALNKRDVVINSNYYGLALNSDSADTGKYVAPPNPSNQAWSISGTVATYKANVTEGYTAASDGSSVTYTAAAEDTNKVTLATVSGLKSGLENSDLTAGLTFGTDPGKEKEITVASNLVGTSNIEVTGTNYTLKLEADHTNGIYLADDPEATTGVDVWRVDGTTATYKKVKYAKYGIAADGKSIVYTPEADVADGTFVTVEGLKSGLTVADDGQSLLDGSTPDVLTLDTSGANPAIVLTAGALGTTGVTLTNGAAATEAGTTYELSLGDSTAEEALAPHMSDVDNGEVDPNLTWSLNGTTAELKGMLVAGYTLDQTTKDTITYTPENSGHVFATLTGLKSGITAGDLEGITGIESATDTEIKLDSRVLGTDTVLLDDVGVLGTPMGYTLAVETTDENYKVNGDDTDTAYFWTVNNGTATYKSATEAYYTPGKQDEDNDTVNNKITFTARDTEHATEIATLTGLKSGLTVVNDAIAGIDTEDGGSIFTISRDVLGTSNVTIESSSPTFTLADGTAPEQDGGYYWTVEGSTAYYQFKSTAGYTQDDSTANAEIVYQAAKSGNNANTVAQITGLKSGINKAAVESNIDVSDDGNNTVTFKLNEAVLGTTNVTLAEGTEAVEGNTYVLGLDGSVAAPDDTKAGWAAYDATNKSYTLKNYTTAGYEVDTDNGSTTIVYTAGSLGEAIATVTGLKAGLTPNASTAQIAGIDIDYDNNKLILSANVLQKDKDTNVAIEADPNASETYALDLATTVATPAYTKAWAIKSGTATLTQEMSEGYVIGEAGSDYEGQVIYKPKETVTTTISGLSSNVKVSDDKQQIGIQSGTTFSGITTPSDSINSSTATTKVDTPIPTSGEITLHKDALAGNATVTVATRNTNNTADYTLADFTGGQDLVTPTTAHWVKAANSTTATYQTETAQGYSRTDDHKITYYSNASGTPTVTATLKGLDKTVTAADLTSAIGAPTLPTYTTDPITGEVTGTTPGVFTITDKSIFGKNNVTLTATDYIMNFHDGSAVNDNAFANSDITNENAYWTYDGKNGKASLVAGTTGGWTFKVNNAGKANQSTDYKTIVYTAAKPVTIATVTGLAKNTTYKPISVTTEDGKSVLKYGTGAEDYSLIATFSSNGNESAATTTTTNKAAATILVDKGILTTETQTGSNPVVSSNTTVSVSSKAGYEFTLKADGDVYTPKDSDKYWTVDNKGNAYYKYDTSAGYTPNTAGTSLVYSAEKSGSKATVIAKISGLDKTARPATADGVKLTEIDGIRITAPVEDDPSTTEVNEAAAGVFTLWNKDILTNKVTLSVTKGQPDYNLGVDEQIATADGGTKWYFKNGTATYRDYRTAGYELNAKNSKLVESKGDIAGKTYVTISGLAKSTTDGTTTTAITEDRIKNESLIIVNADKTITLSDKIQGKTTITLANAVERKDGRTNIYYDYTIDPNSYTTNARVVNDPAWTVANGTATLKQTTGAGFTLGDLNTNNGKQALTYYKESTATLATVKGLANNFAVLTDAQAEKYNTANAAAITAGTLNAVTEGTFYTVSTEKVGNKNVTKYTVASDPLLSYNADKIITVDNAALASKNVTVSGKSGYTLALGSTVTKNRAETTTGWVVNGTTANYKDYVQDYYSLNTAGTTITYTKPKDIKVYATVTGLAKDSEIDSTNWSGTKEGGVLTLTAANLGTSTIKIASKVAGQDTFLLALASDADTKLSTATNAGTWTLKNGTYTLSNNITVGFTQDFGGKTLTYNNKANKAVTVATVTGLNTKAKTTDITVSGDTITLSADALTNKNVAVTTNWGDTNYKLDIAAGLAPTFIPDDNSDATGEEGSPKDPSATKVPGWAISGSKGTLKGYVSAAGYTLSASGKSITYTGATAVNKKKVSGEDTYFYKDTATLATITGLKTTADKTALLDNGTINLTSANTNGNLTLSTGVFAVEVDSSYAGKTITGSAGADDLTVNAAGKTITGGKGDDKIDLGSGGSNTFVYNNGDGHDVIANFEATDKLQVNSGAVSVGMVGSDVVVKVGAGSINLGDSYTGDTIDIYAKDGKTKTTYAIQGSYTGAIGSPNPLLVDDNYSMNAASLSDLVQPDSATFTPYDFDGGFSLTKEDKLTPQISYNNSDKK